VATVALLLNGSFEPLKVVSAKRAVVLGPSAPLKPTTRGDSTRSLVARGSGGALVVLDDPTQDVMAAGDDEELVEAVGSHGPNPSLANRARSSAAPCRATWPSQDWYRLLPR
jgi:hypothetical protein